jgi:AcrR family transcriptional regulator
MSRYRAARAEEVPVLVLVSEQGAIPLDQLARFLAHDRAETLVLVERLWQAGFVRCERLLADEPAWVWLSARGATQARTALPLFRPAIGGLRRLRAVNEVRLSVSRGGPGGGWIARRVLRSRLVRGGLPDGVLERGGRWQAIDVRLDTATPQVLRRLVRRRSGEFDALTCFCAPQAASQLRRLAKQSGWSELVVRPLPSPELPASWAAADIPRRPRPPLLERRAHPSRAPLASPPPWERPQVPASGHPPRRAARPRQLDFPRLPAGRHGVDAGAIEARQRGRLLSAAIELGSTGGLEGLGIAELVGLAGLSQATFYRLYPDKWACFLAALGLAATRIGDRLERAYRSAPGAAGGITAALETLAQLVEEEPSAWLVFLEAPALGSEGARCVEDALAGVLPALREDLAGEGRELSDAEGEALVAAWIGVAGRRLRGAAALGDGRRLEELQDFSLGCPGAMASPPAPPGPRPTPLGPRLSVGWEEPPASESVRRGVDQRRRIVQAAAQLLVEEGYQALSIPAISARAGTSNQTWYRHFRDKAQACVAAFDELGGEAAAALGAVEAGGGVEASTVSAKLDALLGFLAGGPVPARLALIHLATVGPLGQGRIDLAQDALARCLLPAPSSAEAGSAIAEATTAACWAAARRRLIADGEESLPGLAPEIAALLRMASAI